MAQIEVALRAPGAVCGALKCLQIDGDPNLLQLCLEQAAHSDVPFRPCLDESELEGLPVLPQKIAVALHPSGLRQQRHGLVRIVGVHRRRLILECLVVERKRPDDLAELREPFTLFHDLDDPVSVDSDHQRLPHRDVVKWSRFVVHRHGAETT